MIKITDAGIVNRIKEDKAHFEKVIGGGSWSDRDVLVEWIKILDSRKI